MHAGTTGLQYLRARWYQPQTGRFTQVDPFAGYLGLPETQHPYMYGLNNPTRYTDPSGESPLLFALSAGIFGGMLGGAIAYTTNLVAQTTPCNPWWKQWNLEEAFFWTALGGIIGASTILASFGIASLMQWLPTIPGFAMLATRLGLAFWNGLASGIGYTVPALLLGTFDTRELLVSVGVGALFGAFPEFLGGVGLPSVFRGALANEMQYVASALVCNDIASLASLDGHLMNIGAGGLMGAFSGPSHSPDFDSIVLRTQVPQVYNHISGRYADQFLWGFVKQVVRSGQQELLRALIWEVANSVVTTDEVYQMLGDLERKWFK